MNIRSYVSLGFLLVVPFVNAEAEVGNNPCLNGPTAEFGRYVGDWKIDDQQFAKDGSGWSAGAGARWVFECIGDGKAVQDYWMPNGQGWGTNLRTYNADTGKWEIVWVASPQAGMMHISAKRMDDDSIRMTVLKPAQTPPRRITFMPPDEAGWDWVMEMSFDNEKTWTPVYKIRATPWKD